MLAAIAVIGEYGSSVKRATATQAIPQQSDSAGAIRPPPQKASAMPMAAATRIAVAFAAVAMTSQRCQGLIRISQS